MALNSKNKHNSYLYITCNQVNKGELVKISYLVGDGYKIITDKLIGKTISFRGNMFKRLLFSDLKIKEARQVDQKNFLPLDGFVFLGVGNACPELTPFFRDGTFKIINENMEIEIREQGRGREK